MWSLLLLTALTVQAQTRQISGKVSDQKTGLPIPGASVTVKGTNVVTATDADGSFSLQVPQNATTLVITSIGYGLLEMAISDIMNVQLNVSEGNLSEVIVTGYGSQIKKDLTGNIARIKAKDLENVPLPSVDAALQGRAAGVYVNSQSGKLGQAVTVRVRGNSSISASSQPLYVLDGVPITTDDQSTYGGAMNPLVDLNPNDIESVEVLKDAAATAIYGARGANGVIVVTTKSGKPGRMVVDRSISRRWAIFFHLFFSFAGVLMGFYIGLQNGNWIIGFANMGCVFVLWFYSTTFKKRLLTGNILISLLTAWVVFVVYLLTIHQQIDLMHTVQPGSHQKLLRLAILYSSFAFIITLIREVVKDIEDMDGDAKYGCKTMPIVWGVSFSKVFVSIWIVILLVLLIVVLFYVLQFRMWIAAGYNFLLIILPTAYVLFLLFKANQTKDFSLLSKWIKAVIFTGIVSMILFKFFA